MKDKPFDEWNEIKKFTDERQNYPGCKVGEVWWCKLGFNIGKEQSCFKKDFSRPVLIIKTFGRELSWGLPITSKIKSGRNYKDIGNNDKLRGSIILSQLRVFDNRRFTRKIIDLNANFVEQVVSEVIYILGK